MKVPIHGCGIYLWQVELAAAAKRESVSNVIRNLLTNKRNWIESERTSLFWCGQGWSVNKMSEEHDDFIIHEFEEEELDKAIEQFIESSQDDIMSKTEEDILNEENLFCHRESGL